MGEVIKVRAGELFVCPVRVSAIDVGFDYQAVFKGPAADLGTMREVHVSTGMGAWGTRIGDSNFIILTGTVPMHAPPGEYDLVHVKQVRLKDSETRIIARERIAGAPQLEVLSALGDGEWPKVG